VTQTTTPDRHTPAATATVPLTPGHWTLDPYHSAVNFTVRHLGLSNVRGRFARFDAALEVGSDLASTHLAAEVDLSSVETGNADRDTHLRSSDFFAVDEHPTMTFRATSIVGGREDYELTGELTIAGVTKEVTLDVEFHGTEVFPADQSTHAGFTATGEIRRSDFGIDFGIVPGEKLLLGDRVKVELDVQLIAPTGA
jgi:polyisoprenoid-binding protein YceI